MEGFQYNLQEILRSSRREVQLLLAQTDAEASLAASTKAKYRSALASYLSFCFTEGISTKSTVENLSRFISVSVRTPSNRTGRPLSPRSVSCYLSGIAASLLPQYPFVKSITDHPIVRKTLRGAMKMFSKPVVRKDPISLEDIVVVASGTGNTMDKKLFLAILAVGFHGLHRLGELTSQDSQRATDDRKSILRNTLSFSRCGKYAKYILPYHKGGPYFLGSEVLLASCDLPGGSVYSLF